MSDLSEKARIQKQIRDAEKETRPENDHQEFFDCLITPQTPIAFTIYSELNPEGDIIFGYITNVDNKTYRSLPADFIFKMDVAKPVKRAEKWHWGFEQREISKDQILAGTLDGFPLDEPDFGADYQFYKHPKKVQKAYRKAIGMDENKKGFAGSKVFNNQPLFISLVVGFFLILFIICFTSYAFFMMGS